VRFLGIASAHSGFRASVGKDPRKTRPRRLGPADHARGADRRCLVQQRIRPPQSRRLLPRLRDGSGRSRPRLPQTDHDRGRYRKYQRGARSQKPGGTGGSAGALGRSGIADRDGRGRRVEHGRGRQSREPGLRFGAARQRRDAEARSGGHRPLLAARRAQSTSVRAGSRTPFRSLSTSPGGVPGSTCAACPTKSLA